MSEEFYKTVNDFENLRRSHLKMKYEIEGKFFKSIRQVSEFIGIEDYKIHYKMKKSDNKEVIKIPEKNIEIKLHNC